MFGQLFFLILLYMRLVYSYNKEMTIQIEAGTDTCLYHPAKIGQYIDMEYQVIDGGHGDLDINFRFVDPTGRIIITDTKQSDNNHRHDVKSDGDYRFCFDNTFSSFNRKTVFFDIVVDSVSERNAQVWDENVDGLAEEESYDVKVQDIQEIIGHVRQHLNKVRQFQDLLRSFEARDRNLAELNYFKVNAWSFFQVIAMFVVGGIQVFMVRSIFETNSKMNIIWKKLHL